MSSTVAVNDKYVADLPYRAGASGHDQYSQIGVLRELMQDTFAFGRRAFAVDALMGPRVIRNVVKVAL